MLPFSPSSTDQKYIVLRQGRVEEAKATLHTLRGDSYAEEKIVEVLWACQKIAGVPGSKFYMWIDRKS
jgi:hypothetical protein